MTAVLIGLGFFLLCVAGMCALMTPHLHDGEDHSPEDP